jgi:ketosteroid isomerase-like protein
VTRTFLVVMSVLFTGSLSCVEPGRQETATPVRDTAAAAPVEPTSGSIDAMVSAERAFAKAAEDTSVREAFITYMSEDSIILYPPGPVHGREHWQKRPAPPPREPGKPRPISLLWAPVSGDISIGGDMGYTTGPFVVRDNTGKEPDAHGLFFSVWEKQPSGNWRVILDVGVSTPQPVYDLAAAFQRATPPLPLPRNAPSQISAEDLKRLDIEFKTLSASKPVQAFQNYFAPTSRLHRSDRMPLTKKEDILAYAVANLEEYTPEPMFARMARSHDLGYTYGAYQLVEKGKAASPEKGHYARVWQLHPEGWKVVAEVVLSAPAKG